MPTTTNHENHEPARITLTPGNDATLTLNGNTTLTVTHQNTPNTNTITITDREAHDDTNTRERIVGRMVTETPTRTHARDKDTSEHNAIIRNTANQIATHGHLTQHHTNTLMHAGIDLANTLADTYSTSPQSPAYSPPATASPPTRHSSPSSKPPTPNHNNEGEGRSNHGATRTAAYFGPVRFPYPPKSARKRA